MSHRHRGRPFRRGQSGNPKGRPPTGQSIAEHIRRLGGEDGSVYVAQLHRLATVRHQDTRARLTALGLLLDRGYGKPAQAVAVSADVRTTPDAEATARMSDEELLEELEEAVATIRSRCPPRPAD